MASQHLLILLLVVVVAAEPVPAAEKPTREQIVAYAEACKNSKKQADFVAEFGIDFSGMDLSGVDLRGHHAVGYSANLRGAAIRGIDELRDGAIGLANSCSRATAPSAIGAARSVPASRSRGRTRRRSS